MEERPKNDPERQAALEVPGPDLRGFRRLLFLLGAMAAAFISFATIASNTGAGPAFWVVGALFYAFAGWKGLGTNWLTAYANQVNVALGLITRDRLDLAERVLDKAESGFLIESQKKLTAGARGILAFKRGNLAEAIAYFDVAIDGRAIVPGTSRSFGDLQRFQCLPFRALTRALSGDLAGARRDLELHDRLPGNLPDIALYSGIRSLQQARARADIARALVMKGEGEIEALKSFLDQRGLTLLEGVTPRERALLRAVRRSIQDKTVSPYRESAEAEEERDAEAWTEKVAPELARFVEKPVKGSGDLPASALRAGERAAISGDTGRRGRRLGFALPFAVVAGFAVYAIDKYRFERAHSGKLGPFDQIVSPLLDIPSAFYLTGFFVLLVAGIRWSASRKRKEFANTLVAQARGEEGTTQIFRGFEALDQRTQLGSSASAILAETAIAEGRFEDALLHADRTLGMAHRQRRWVRLTTGAVLSRAIHARAVALAGLGRDKEALREVKEISDSEPFKQGIVFEVSLLAAITTGKTELAREVAASCPSELPLPLRVELLRDLVRATSTRLGIAEVDRLRSELATSPKYRAWLAKVAPSWMKEFEAMQSSEPLVTRAPITPTARRPSARIATAPSKEAERDRAAEAEAEAETDALAEAESDASTDRKLEI